MALSTGKLTSSLPFHPSRFRFRLFSASPPRTPWLQNWPPLDPTSSPPSQKPFPPPSNQPKPPVSTSIERIVHRLRNLGVDGEEEEEESSNSTASSEIQLDGNEKLGDLLERSWTRPDHLPPSNGPAHILPWERELYKHSTNFNPDDFDPESPKPIRTKAPTMAELTIEDAELRRLRTLGIHLRERISVAKAGVTQPIVEKIHDAWRKNELVRLKFHESLAHDMRTAHELVERRTGGLVVWRSGSVMVVYRGPHFKYPSHSGPPSLHSKNYNNNILIPSFESPPASSAPPPITNFYTALSEEEEEFSKLLDGLGPRFHDWWGTGVVPVDADLLPETVNGYKTPLRLLPAGMRSRLTNSEMTELRHAARKLPCHFALGRNKKHQGLAVAILKLWETSLVAKIAVKRGIQNTNNKHMAEELKRLTGGTLIQRNKFYIVIYRGKDFLPPGVASVLAERQELTDNIQSMEEQTRVMSLNEELNQGENNDNNNNNNNNDELKETEAPVGTLAEFRQAMAQWGREISIKEREEMREEVSRSEKDKLMRKFQHKLYISQQKKDRAERLLAKVESRMVPVGPTDDREMLTNEERSVFRRIGLRMKSYLPMGIRGVFDGVIENMHLHWKHRELVKLISKPKNLAYLEDTARLLEFESGGILVAIEKLPKGYALIFYRGKNYKRPISIRPRNLLTKNKALKRAVAIQRHEALSQHILGLEDTIRQMKAELGIEEDEEDLSFENRPNNTSPLYDESEDNEDFKSEDENYDSDDETYESDDDEFESVDENYESDDEDFTESENEDKDAKYNQD